MTAWSALLDTNNPLPEYPRPQLARSNWMSLNGIWQFQSGSPADAVPIGQTLSGQILAPYPMESAISGVMQHYEYSWYRRLFTVPAGWSGKRILLHLDAVNWQAAIYVNGSLMLTHKGGYDPFSCDITAALVAGSNELIIQVYSPVDNAGEPRGKQTLYPGGIMYTAASGIWQPVWLEPVDAYGVNTLRLTPDVDNGLLRMTVNTYATAGVTVYATALSNGVAVSAASGVPAAEIDLPLPNAALWAPENPFLYGLQIAVARNGATNDTVSSYFGMRKISVQNVSGVPQIFLNNQRYFEMGPLDQGFWPDGIYTAPTDAALAYDLQLEKALGFNMVRKHIKVEPQRWYYWADHLGLLVWQDMPSCNSYTGSPQPIDAAQFEAELTAMVTNHWNAPSIVAWTLFNEGQGQSGNGQTNTAHLVNAVRALDASRLINQASGNDYYGVGDILDNHSYPDPGDPLSSTQATVDGEFGGIAWHVDGHLWNSAQAGNGYLLASSLDNFANLYDGYLNEVLNYKSLSNGGLNAAVYTQITDVENECNGLLTYDRLVKPSMDRIYVANLKAITGQIAITPVVATSQTVPQSWLYTTNAPPANWYASNFDASSWRTGVGGFGAFAPNVTPNTAWTTPGYIYLRRTFNPGTLTADQIANLAFTLYHDEDVVIYINGVFAASASGYSTTYVTLPISAQVRAALVPNGTNVLAVSCYQTVGGQFIDVGLSVVQLSASVTVTPTPPAILLPPVSQTVPSGATASFCAQAVGGGLSYQWTQGGQAIPGATNNILVLSNAAASAGWNVQRHCLQRGRPRVQLRDAPRADGHEHSDPAASLQFCERRERRGRRSQRGAYGAEWRRGREHQSWPGAARQHAWRLRLLRLRGAARRIIDSNHEPHRRMLGDAKPGERVGGDLGFREQRQPKFRPHSLPGQQQSQHGGRLHAERRRDGLAVGDFVSQRLAAIRVPDLRLGFPERETLYERGLGGATHDAERNLHAGRDRRRRRHDGQHIGKRRVWRRPIFRGHP